MSTNETGSAPVGAVIDDRLDGYHADILQQLHNLETRVSDLTAEVAATQARLTFEAQQELIQRMEAAVLSRLMPKPADSRIRGYTSTHPRHQPPPKANPIQFDIALSKPTATTRTRLS